MAIVTAKVTQIRAAILGIDVRESIASGIEGINTEVTSTTARQGTIEISQTALREQFDAEIENMTLVDPSSAEIVAGRTSNVTAKTFDKMGYRVDDIDEQLAETTLLSVKHFGIIDDGITDQTAELIALFAGELLTYKGTVLIPYNVKFEVSTVYPSISPSIMIYDLSGINFYSSETYKTKYTTFGSSDLVDNDSSFQILSGHHPNLIINNLGTSGTSSAEYFRSTILHAFGIKPDRSVKINMAQQVFMSGDKWLYLVKLASKFLTPDVSVDVGLFGIDENGHVGVGSGPSNTENLTVQNNVLDLSATTIAKVKNINNSSQVQFVLESKKADGTLINTVFVQLSTDVCILKRNGVIYQTFANGSVETTCAKTLRYTAISGVTPDVSTGLNFVLTSTIATNVTNFITTLVGQEIRIIFKDGNTTLVNGSMRLKGNVDWTPTALSSITLIKNSSLTSAWIEVCRNEI